MADSVPQMIISLARSGNGGRPAAQPVGQERADLRQRQRRLRHRGGGGALDDDVLQQSAEMDALPYVSAGAGCQFVRSVSDCPGPHVASSQASDPPRLRLLTFTHAATGVPRCPRPGRERLPYAGVRVRCCARSDGPLGRRLLNA